MKTMQDLLLTQPVSVIADSAMRLGVEAVDTGGKSFTKAQWAEKVTDAFHAAPGILRTCLGLNGMEALADEDEANPFPDKGSWQIAIRDANADDDLKEALEELRRFGLAWRDRHAWHVLPDFAPVLSAGEDDWDMLETESQVLQMIAVMLNLYGIAPIRTVLDTLADREDLDERRTDPLLRLYVRWNGMRGIYRTPDGEVYLLSDLCDDPESLWQDQQLCTLHGYNWKIVPLDEIFTFAGCSVPLTNSGASLLTDVAAEAGLDPDELAWYLEEALMALQEKGFDAAVDALAEAFPDGQVTDGRKWVLRRCVDQLPLWGAKGRTGAELRDMGSSLKPGDLCPCGSGRTYGRCHGRLN